MKNKANDKPFTEPKKSGKNAYRLLTVTVMAIMLICALLLSSCGIGADDINGTGEPEENYPITYSFSGAGTIDNPFEIRTADDLAAIGQGKDVYHRLINDIDLSEYNNINPESVMSQWKIIENYRGNLDGNGKVIKGLTFYNQKDNLALIATNSGTISNLNVEIDINVNGAKSFCALVHENNGKITDCTLNGNIVATDTFVFGMVNVNNGQLIHSYANVNISAIGNKKANLGGLVALNNGKIEDCWSSGHIVATDDNYKGRYVGGLVMNNQSDGVISRSASNMSMEILGKRSVTTKTTVCVGGLTGINAGRIENCYFAGDIKASGKYCFVAGLSASCSGTLYYSYSAATALQASGWEYHIGALFCSTDSNEAQAVRSKYCYYDGELANVGEPNTAKSFEDIDLKNPDLFVGWDREIWVMESGSYPRLKTVGM